MLDTPLTSLADLQLRFKKQYHPVPSHWSRRDQLWPYFSKPGRLFRPALLMSSYQMAAGYLTENTGKQQKKARWELVWRLASHLERLQLAIIGFDDYQDGSQHRHDQASLPVVLIPEWSGKPDRVLESQLLTVLIQSIVDCWDLLVDEPRYPEQSVQVTSYKMGVGRFRKEWHQVLAQLLGDLSVAALATPLQSRRTLAMLFVGCLRQTLIGQRFDNLLVWTNPQSSSIHESDLWRLYERKTAYYTTVLPLFMGFGLAGRWPSAQLSKTLQRLTLDLGCLYQLLDDLRLVNEELPTDKDRFSDLAGGQVNMLTWNTALRLLPEDQENWRQLCRRCLVSPEYYETTLELILKSGSVQYCYKLVNELTKRIMMRLNVLAQEGYDTNLLQELIQKLVKGHGAAVESLCERQ